MGAPPASAANSDDGAIHYCGSLLDPKADDGPVTDFIHHNVEPLTGVLRDQVHGINCVLLSGVLGL